MRTTVASLVPVSSARPVTVRAAQPAGSCATASATRCMERVIDGASVRTLAARAAGAGAAPTRAPKVSFTSRVTVERYFQYRGVVKSAHNGCMEPISPLEQALHTARALVLADLVAGEVAEADVVSLVEESVVQRRWWVEQWPDGVEYVAGLVAQDVQDALLDRYGRWPLCPVCGSGDPHALEVEPELGPDPHWVCHQAGVKVAAVGALGSAGSPGPTGPTGPTGNA